MLSQPAAAEGALVWRLLALHRCTAVYPDALCCNFHACRSTGTWSGWLLMGHVTPAGAAEEAVDIQEQVMGLHSGGAAVSCGAGFHAGVHLPLCRPHAGALHM